MFIYLCLLDGSYTFETVFPLFNPVLPLKYYNFENEFQIQNLHPQTMLGTKYHRNRKIFIFGHFGGSYYFRDYIAPIWPPIFNP